MRGVNSFLIRWQKILDVIKVSQEVVVVTGDHLKLENANVITIVVKSSHSSLNSLLFL